MMKASQINQILLQNHKGPSIIQMFYVGNLIAKTTFKQCVVNGFFFPFRLLSKFPSCLSLYY
jgi:hypothetical protein